MGNIGSPLQGQLKLISENYREKYGPAIPTRTLARIIQFEHPMFFPTIERARSSLRMIEGKQGVAMLDKLSNKSFVLEGERPKNPWNFPIPDADDLEPYILPSTFNNFILASDFHFPNHRQAPIDAMMRYREENGIDQCFLNGDLLDNTPFSKWVHKPIKPGDTERWFNMVEDFLRQMKTFFKDVYWLEGNHDFWYSKWLMQHAPHLYSDSYFALTSRLHLNDIGVTYIPQEYLVKAGHLNIIHGHIVFRGGGTYANGARMLYMKTKANCIASHLHVPTEHVEPDLNDKVITTWVTGCMCSLRPEYQPYGGKAAHGFAHIRVKENGDFNVKNFKIQKGEIL